MPLVPPQRYLKIENLHRIGVASNKPAAADVVPGTLYHSTDTRVLERSDGTSWSSYPSIGEKVDIPYNAGDFAGRGAMTWTVDSGDVETLSYGYIGKNLVMLSFAINTTSVGGTLNNWLQIQLPFTALVTSQNIGRKLEGGVGAPIICSVVGGESLLKLLNLDLSNWAAATNTTYVFGVVPVWV